MDNQTDIKTDIQADLSIIGTGMAGLSAALFALDQGLSVVLTGKISSIHFATGLMDLMGVYPPGYQWDDPFAAIDRIRKEVPEHPYAAISNEDIDKALGRVQQFLGAQGLPHRRKRTRNVDIITSMGTLKKSHLIPLSMWQGVAVLERRLPTLLVDFTGLKIYSARQIVSALGADWKGLRDATIQFPGMELMEEVFPEHMARSLDVATNVEILARKVLPLIKDSKAVGFPALLGMYVSCKTIRTLERLLGVTVFEIPTPPVSVPGIRLQELFLKGLQKNDALLSLPEMVKRVESFSNGTYRITAGESGTLKRIESKGVILATGRFLGKGLTAERTGIRESLMGIPVVQPGGRDKWHNAHLFDPLGHPVNRSGLQVDRMFRPLTETSMPFSPGLFAAGSILAHCDWTRLKCGSGVAIATAHAAVRAFCKRYK
ncbi:glycerol-3-phosphate dehydrogenase subunit GlpB [Desulfocicer niacini]